MSSASTNVDSLLKFILNFRKRRRTGSGGALTFLQSTSSCFLLLDVSIVELSTYPSKKRTRWRDSCDTFHEGSRKHSRNDNIRVVRRSHLAVIQALCLLVLTLISVAGRPSIQSQYAPCVELLTQADRNGDSLLSDLEFLAAIRLLAGGGVVDASTKVKLSSELQASLGSGGVPYTDPVFTEMLCTAIYDGIIIAALESELTPLTCSAAFLLGDRNRDDLLSRGDEFSRFVSRLSNGIYPLTTTFETLPYVVQNIFDLFSTGDEIDIYGSKTAHRNATEEQVLFTTNLCRQTTVAIVLVDKGLDPGSPGNPNTSPAATAHPTSTTVATKAPTSTPSLPREGGSNLFSFTFQECQRAIALSDISRNNFLEESEFVRFVDRLSNSHFSDAGNLAGLPKSLQDVFEDLATNNGDGQRISVEGGKPSSTPSAEQLQSVQRVCQATLDAMNASVHPGGSTPVPATPTMSPTSVSATAAPTQKGPDEVLVDIDKCKQDMIVSDLSRDSKLNEQEFVRFVSRNTDTVGLNDVFTTMPQHLRDTFYSLAAMTDETDTINVEGARRGSVVSAEQEAYLERVCRDTLSAIFVANKPETDIPTISPTSLTTTEATSRPTEPPSADASGPPGNNAVIYNAFVVTDSAGGRASSISLGNNRRALDQSYDKFVRRIVMSFNTSRIVRNLRRGASSQDLPWALRRLKIASLLDESIELFDIVDSECPAAVADQSWSCMSVYGTFAVTLKDNSSRDIFQEYAQNALIQDDLLQSLLLEADPDVTISVVGLTDTKEKPTTMTAAPTQTPGAPPIASPEESGKGNGRTIAMIVVIVVVGTGGGLYFLGTRREKSPSGSGEPRSKKAPSDKTAGDGSDGEDPDIATPRTNDYGFEDNSDDSGERGASLFAKEVSEDSEEDEISAEFSVKEQSTERSRMRLSVVSGITTGITKGGTRLTSGVIKGGTALTKGTGTVLGFANTLTGGVAGNIAHGVQKGVQTVGGEVLKGAKTVGQTVQTVGQKTLDTGVMAAGTVGNVGLGLVGTATGGLIGIKKKSGVSDEGDDNINAISGDKEFDENAEDFANYTYDDPEELKQLDGDPFANTESDPWKSSGDEWNRGKPLDVSKELDGDNSRSYDDEESGTGTESYNESDDRTRESLTKTSDTPPPGKMLHLDALVDQGDWVGVMEAAAKFDNHFDDFSVPSKGIDDHEKEPQDASETEGSSVAEDRLEYSGDFDDGADRISLTAEDLKRRDQYRKQIETLVKQCVPEELDNISAMMDQFAGREAELINTLQSMTERVSSQRARKAIHKRKAIPERESRTFPPGGVDGSAAIAAASTIGGSFPGEARRDENGGSFSEKHSGSEDYTEDDDGGSQDDPTGSHEDSYENEDSQSYEEGLDVLDEHDDDVSGSYTEGDAGSYDDDGFNDPHGTFPDEEDEPSASASSGEDSYDEEPEDEYGDEDSYPDDGDDHEDATRPNRRGDMQPPSDGEGSYYSDEDDEARSQFSGEEEGSYYSEEGSPREGGEEGSYYSDEGSGGKGSEVGSYYSEGDSRGEGGEEGSYYSGEGSGSKNREDEGSYASDDDGKGDEGEGSYYSGEGSRSGDEGEGSYYSGEGSQSGGEGEGSYYSGEESRGPDDDEGSYYSDEGSHRDGEDRSYDSGEKSYVSGEGDEGSYFSGDEEGSYISGEEDGSYESGSGSRSR